MNKKDILLNSNYYTSTKNIDVINLYTDFNFAALDNADKSYLNMPFTFKEIIEYKLSNDINIFDIKNIWDIGKFRVYCNSFHSLKYNKLLKIVESLEYDGFDRSDFLGVESLFKEVLKSLNYDGYINNLINKKIYYQLAALVQLYRTGSYHNEANEIASDIEKNIKKYSIIIFSESKNKLIETKKFSQNNNLAILRKGEINRIKYDIIIDILNTENNIDKQQFIIGYFSILLSPFDKYRIYKKINVDMLSDFINNMSGNVNSEKIKKWRQWVYNNYIYNYFN